jgi:hypothetical protein
MLPPRSRVSLVGKRNSNGCARRGRFEKRFSIRGLSVLAPPSGEGRAVEIRPDGKKLSGGAQRHSGDEVAYEGEEAPGEARGE